jgi:hypothetical protein
VIGDLMHHVILVTNPRMEVAFDTDPKQGIETRSRNVVPVDGTSAALARLNRPLDRCRRRAALGIMKSLFPVRLNG